MVTRHFRVVSCPLVGAEENPRFPRGRNAPDHPTTIKRTFLSNTLAAAGASPKSLHIPLTRSTFANFNFRLPQFRATRQPNLACFQRAERCRTMPPRTRSQSRALAQATRHASGLDSGETAHPTTTESQVTLPADILYLIVAQCDRDWRTLMELRLTCKLLAAEAAKYLFKDVYVTFYDEHMYQLVRVAEWPIPAKSVKSLTIQDCPLIPELSFYRFRKYVELTGGWSLTPVAAHRLTE